MNQTIEPYWFEGKENYHFDHPKPKQQEEFDETTKTLAIGIMMVVMFVFGLVVGYILSVIGL